MRISIRAASHARPALSANPDTISVRLERMITTAHAYSPPFSALWHRCPRLLFEVSDLRILFGPLVCQTLYRPCSPACGISGNRTDPSIFIVERIFGRIVDRHGGEGPYDDYRKTFDDIAALYDNEVI